MARVGSTPVIKQPQTYSISNNFSLMGNEIVLHTWEYKDGAGGCVATYYTTLTDTRVLIRSEVKNCCERESADISIFLRDIAEMVLTTENRDCCTMLCRKCCIRCCRTPKLLELRGVFGSQILHIPKADMEILLISIAAAIGNHKLVDHHSFL